MKADIDYFRNICKMNNLKLTPQREIIYLAIKDERNHPTAENIYIKVKKKLPNVTFDTVNRTLKTFSEIGLLNFIPAYSSSKRYDPKTTIHHHCHCIKCNKIIDIHYEPYNKINIPKQLPEGFQGKAPVIIIEGLCNACQS